MICLLCIAVHNIKRLINVSNLESVIAARCDIDHGIPVSCHSTDMVFGRSHRFLQSMMTAMSGKCGMTGVIVGCNRV